MALQREVVVELPAHRRAARLARSLVRAQAGTRLRPPVLEDLLLLTSEVVTNAVLHGAPPITMQLDFLDLPSGARVSVTDARDQPPTVRAASRDATAGRGMAVVDAVAHRWGVEWLPQGGKTIWFEVLDDGQGRG